MPAVDKRAVFKRIGYDPHPKQWLFHDSDARFKIAASGRRFGKSISAAAELFVNDNLNIWEPDLIFWIVGPKYVHSAKEFRYVMRFLKKHPGRKKRSLWEECPHKAFNIKQGDMHVTLPWGTEIVALSAQHKDNLIGEGIAGVIVSEAAKQDADVWEQFIRPALYDYAPRSWAIFPSTPEGFNHFHTLFKLGDSKSLTKMAGYESWSFPSWDNPILFPKGFDSPEIQQALESAKAAGMEEVFWQETGASFRSVVGLIYGREWDDELHIYEEYFDKDYEYRPEWEDYTAVDWGFTNPLVVLDIQIDPMDNLYVWREHYLTKHSTPQHIGLIQERKDPEGYKVIRGYADAANPDGVEQFSMSLWPTMADPEAKEWQRGVDEVKEFLIGDDAQPHIWVSKNCPMTIWEFQNYRVKKASGQQTNTAEQAHQFANHCLVSDTPITTTRGQVPISDVLVGDEVLTRKGWRSVLRSGQTGRDAEIWEVGIGDRIVRGTAEHLFWVVNRGWVHLDSLRYGDIVVTCDELKPLTKSNIEALSTDDIPTPKLGPSEVITDQGFLPRRARRRLSIVPYTKTISALFRRAITSITSTKTRLTIRRRTSWRYCREITTRWLEAVVRPRFENILQPSENLRPNGIEVLRGGLGTANMLGRFGKIDALLDESVLLAAANSSPLLDAKTTNTARTIASPQRVAPVGLMTRLESAPSVGRDLQQTDIAKLKLALGHAQVSSSPKRNGRADVFDLTVEDAHEFFANGVLVHNSMDALRYFVMHHFVLYGGRDSLKDAMTPPNVGDNDRRGSGFFTTDNETLFTLDSAL